MDFLLEFIQISPYALWGLFALLILCGVGLPMPEDIILIAAGILAAERGDAWVFISLLMYAGVLIGDSLIFLVGRKYGSRLLQHRWARRWLSEAKQERISRLLNRWGSAAFFVARFMPGLRAPFFFTSGAIRARFLQFLVFDGLAALVSVPIFVWLGRTLWHRFGDDIEQLSAALSKTHAYTLYIIVGVLVIIATAVWFNRRRLGQAARE